ncbi:MAG TPA: hypothetical protein VGC66_24095 [Pyrinomonadaceae bacterium]|jgi:hypothetical protein
MDSITSRNDLSATANVLGGLLTLPSSLSLSELSLHITVPDFKFRLNAPLLDVTPTFSLGKIVIRAIVDTHVIAVLTLNGNLIQGTTKFQTERFALSFELIEQRPRALFTAASILAMLGVARVMDVGIPEFDLGQRVNFDLPLPVICERLEKRQIAYRLMAIEQATGKEFLLPLSFAGSDLSAISFTYHSIVNRSFIWPDTRTLEGVIPANREGFARLHPINQPTKITFDSIPASKMVLGQLIPLGKARIVIEDAVLQNSDKVKDELEQNDGHQVEILMRSLSGQARYELPDAPHLPDTPWEPFIQELIGLESRLDACVINRYNAMAAATLAGLTEEEKAEITTRPDLDEDAFLMED